MDYNNLLVKQIKKYLPPDCAADERLQPFLSVINDYYSTFERDKKIADHAFAISEKEYKEVVADLKKQYELEQKSILALKEAVNTMDPGSLADAALAENDIIYIINFLK